MSKILQMITADLRLGTNTDLRSAWQRAGASFKENNRTVSAAELKQRERQRLCMARLRAERRGQLLDGFAPRQRRRKGQGLRYKKAG